MNRLDRLQAILTLIQSKKVITAQEIAKRFEISIRTVYRDIRALENAGVPIGSEAGTGYFIDDNYSLPPVMFTPNEAQSLMLAGKMFPELSDKVVNDDFQMALVKIKAVLRSDQKEALEQLEQHVKVMPPTWQMPKSNSIFLTEIQQTLIDKCCIKLHYFASYSQEHTERKVEPVGLLFYGLKWHLIAWCRLRNQYRDFRLDRIKRIEKLQDKIEASNRNKLEDYIQSQKDNVALHKIELLCDANILQQIHESKYWYGFVNEIEDGDKRLLTFYNPELEGFARWIISWGIGIKILSPNSLIKMVVDKVQGLQQAYL